ncbi:hypothetical protein PUR61_02090 [Streptomyces sp. BE20]|uniref:hypothetical protein n=1 Tax=Streptomyces sp. BE20 TaxID=3002525 RepID=UPI002E79D3EB|nr:hypothetical protein [Streptomyces sp. BE20]MEE1820997.1 hypothetical protein [Streptomyces sp. BE20]
MTAPDNPSATAAPDDAEQTVLDLLAAGFTPAAIAARHGVHTDEVNHFIGALRHRYGVRTTYGLLAHHFADPADRARPCPASPAGEGGITPLQRRLLRLIAADRTPAEAAGAAGVRPDEAAAALADLQRRWHTTLEGAVAALASGRRVRRSAARVPPVPDPRRHHGGASGQRELMTGRRTALARHAEQVVAAAPRAVVVLQGGDLAGALVHWRARSTPGASVIGIHAPGERISAGRAPVGCPPVCDPGALTRHLRGPGPLLAVTTVAGAAVLTAVHRAVHLSPWHLLLAEDVLALEAGGPAAAALLSDAAVPARRRILQTTTTALVDGSGRLWTARPGPRHGRAHALGTPAPRPYRLEIALTTPPRPTDGTRRLEDAARTAVAATGRPGTRRLAVLCPNDATAHRLAARAHTLPDPLGRRGPRRILTLTPTQPQRERDRVHDLLAGDGHTLVATTEPLPGASIDALMLLAPDRDPWTTLAVLEQALAARAPELLLLTGPVELPATRRRQAHAQLAAPATVLRTLAALDPGLRRALARDREQPTTNPWSRTGALESVALPDGLSPILRGLVAEVLLNADTPRTAPARRPTPPPAPARESPDRRLPHLATA